MKAVEVRGFEMKGRRNGLADFLIDVVEDWKPAQRNWQWVSTDDMVYHRSPFGGSSNESGTVVAVAWHRPCSLILFSSY